MYQCPHLPQFFHIGNLSEAVIRGDLTRDQAYHGAPRDLASSPEPEGVLTVTSAVVHTSQTPDSPNGYRPEPPGDRTTGQLDVLLSDLATYRYHVGVAVTPTLAARLIGLNAENNRLHKPHLSAKYARDMRTRNAATGEYHWREKTGQTIKISTDGRLLDGLHRMHAVAQGERAVKFDLCFGVDPADILVMDSGSSRTSADVMRILGAPDLGRATPIVKHMIAWDVGYRMGPTGSNIATPIEIAERYAADMLLFDAAAKRGQDLMNRSVTTAAAGGVSYFLLARHPEDKPIVDDWFDDIVSGANISEESAAYALREKLRRRRSDRYTRADMIALFVTAWNRHNTFRFGAREKVERLQVLRSRPGEVGERLSNANFPQPVRARWTALDRIKHEVDTGDARQ